MIKKAKLSLVGLLASAVMFSSVGCLGKPPEVEIPETPGGGMQTTIGDAYDYNEDGTGSTRPTIPGGYYEPTLPITESIVRIAESCNITFADGSKEKVMKLGTPLSTADFAADTLDGHEVGGVAVPGEGGSLSFVDLKDFAPQTETTIIPYYAAENGEYLMFGSSGFDCQSGHSHGIQTGITYANALVDGYKGTSISYGNATPRGGYYTRIKSTLARQADAEYTYSFVFKNLGEATVSFTAYMMNAGFSFATDTANTEPSDPIVLAPGESKFVTIAQDVNKSDSNAMTILCFDAPLADGFTLGVAMSYKAEIDRVPATITIDAPDGFVVSDTYSRAVTTFDHLVLPNEGQITNNSDKRFLGTWLYGDGSAIGENTRIYGDVTIKPLFAESVSISVRLPEGLTLAESYNTTAVQGDTVSLPTADQLIGSGFGEPTGWYNYDTGAIISDNTFTVTGDVTISPYWQTKNGYEYLRLGTGSYIGYNTSEVPGDFYTGSGDNMRSSFSYQGLTGNASSSAKLIDAGSLGTYLGSVISDTQPVTAGSAIRLDSAYTVALNDTYEFAYTVVNSGTSRLKLSIYQINMSYEYRNMTNHEDFYQYEQLRYRVDIDLEPGKSVCKLGQYAFTAQANTNFLTYIVFEEDVDSFKFGLSIGVNKINTTGTVDEDYVEHKPLESYVNLAFDPDDYRGLTVDEEYLRQRVGRLIIAPTEGSEYTLPAGERILRWTLRIDGTEYTIPATRVYNGLRLPSSKTVELVPVFASYNTVTLDLPDGVTLNGYGTTVRLFEGETLTLPTAEQVLVDGGRTVMYWVQVADDGTETKIENGTAVLTDITIRPVLSAAEGASVTVRAGELVNGFTISESYLNAARHVGDALVLPTEGEYTNNEAVSGKRLTGWTVTDAETGMALVENAMTAEGVSILNDSLIITPVFVDIVRVTARLPEGITLNGYDPDLVVGDTLHAPEASMVTDSRTEDTRAIAGWFNVATGAIIGADGFVTDSSSITIAPYFNSYNRTPLSGATADEKGCPYGPDNVTSTLERKFGKENNIIGGDELGIRLTCSVNMSVGDAFRFKTSMGANGSIIKDKATIKYTFCITNYGSETLSFTVYQIRGGSDTTDCPSQAVTLASGESTKFTLTLSYTANNGNALTYFVMNAETSDLNFGISMNYETVTA